MSYTCRTAELLPSPVPLLAKSHLEDRSSPSPSMHLPALGAWVSLQEQPSKGCGRHLPCPTVSAHGSGRAVKIHSDRLHKAPCSEAATDAAQSPPLVLAASCSSSGLPLREVRSKIPTPVSIQLLPRMCTGPSHVHTTTQGRCPEFIQHTEAASAAQPETLTKEDPERLSPHEQPASQPPCPRQVSPGSLPCRTPVSAPGRGRGIGAWAVWRGPCAPSSRPEGPACPLGPGRLDQLSCAHHRPSEQGAGSLQHHWAGSPRRPWRSHVPRGGPIRVASLAHLGPGPMSALGARERPAAPPGSSGAVGSPVGFAGMWSGPCHHMDPIN